VQADAVFTCSRRCCIARMCTRTLSTSADTVSTSMLTAAAWEVPADCTAACKSQTLLVTKHKVEIVTSVVTAYILAQKEMLGYRWHSCC
jgi:hypothetical protein